MGAALPLQNRLRGLYHGIVDMDGIDLVARMTLLLVLLRGGRSMDLGAVKTVACMAGLLLPSLYRGAAFWFLLTALLIVGNVRVWYDLDNNQYLMIYWSLALACVLSLPSPQRAIALNARLLIGLCFAFATLWKLRTGQFLDGSFFHDTFLLDSRFAAFTELFGGLTRDVLREDRMQALKLTSYDSSLQAVPLQGAPHLLGLARGLAWWTVGIEALIALAFLCPEGWRLSRWRHYGLLVFIVTTYAFATVVEFGWLLAVMGIAQCSPDSRRIRFCYVASFFLIYLYTTSWIEPLLTLVRSIRGLG